MEEKVNLKSAGVSGVDKYTANAPEEVQGKLREIRAAIREAAQMPRNAQITSNGLDIPMRATITMGCLSGSALSSQIYGSIYVHQ